MLMIIVQLNSISTIASIKLVPKFEHPIFLGNAIYGDKCTEVKSNDFEDIIQSASSNALLSRYHQDLNVKVECKKVSQLLGLIVL